MKAILSTVMLALAMICTCTQAQENNIDYWLDRGGALIRGTKPMLPSPKLSAELSCRLLKFFIERNDNT